MRHAGSRCREVPKAFRTSSCASLSPSLACSLSLSLSRGSRSVDITSESGSVKLDFPDWGAALRCHG
eukprot:1927110-Pleurochrysis_carterae.AAC.1